MNLNKIEGHSFDAAGLSSKSVVLDLGANHGRFSECIAKLTNCRCIAVEANPGLCEHIRQHTNVEVLECAVAGSAGRVTLRVNQCSESSTILNVARAEDMHSVEIEAKTVEQISQLAGVRAFDLVKVDIEGAEIEMFDQCSDDWIRSVSQFTVEFHDFNGLVPKRDVLRVIRRLERLGFFTVPFWMRTYGDTWFVNRNKHPASLSDLLWLRYVTRNINGTASTLRRWIWGKRRPVGARP